MTIKEGYDGKETRIKVYARKDTDERKAEFWIEQVGLNIPRKSIELKPIQDHIHLGEVVEEGMNGEEQIYRAITKDDYEELRVVSDERGKKLLQVETEVNYTPETLAYVTLNELLTLRDDINDAIQELVA